MSIKAYSYLRFSSTAQAEGDSLRRQLKAAMDWAAERPDVQLDTQTRDLGVSAFKGEHRVKGALASFLERVRQGKIEKGSYFLIESFDRLSRENETIAINLLTSITLAGIRVVTLVDGHEYDDKSDAMDLMRAIIVMSRAHEENKARGAKLRAAWADKKRRARETGEILSRRGPAWTEFNDATKRFDVIEDRASVVRRIFAECLEGLGGTAIASRLNADGVKPFVANSDGWHPGYVLTILKSRSVMGFYQPTFWSKSAGERAKRQHDGEDIPNYYPEIITPEVFERAQGVIHRRNKRGGGRGRRGKTFPNLLIGLGRCEECGGTLVLGNKANSERVRFFRCYHSSRKHRCENKARYLAKPIEKTLEFFLMKARMETEDASPTARELAVLVERQAEIKRRIEVLLDQMEAGVPLVADRLRQRQVEMVAVEKSIEALKRDERAVAHVDRTNAAFRAVQWLRRMEGMEGDDLYRARAKANALLADVFDWVMPVSEGEGGFYAGQGERAYYASSDILAPMRIPADLQITRANLDAIRGPIPADL